MSQNPLKIVGILLGLLVIGSGCSHTAIRSGTRRTPPLPAELAADFRYEAPVGIPVRFKTLETKAEYELQRVVLPVASDRVDGATNRTIELDYYRLKGGTPSPVILVLPMLGGGYSLERHFANYFATRGYSAIIVRRDPRGSKAKVEDLNRLFRDMVMDHRQVIDWVETQSELDANRIGIFGVSMGGIKGALLLPLDNRIRAAALGLAGGDLPYILTHTTEPGLSKRRDEELLERNITLEQSEARLRELLKFDPIRYAPFVDPRKVLLVLARYDTVVPIVKGLELKKRMGNPETILIPAGHYSAVLSIPYIKSQSFDFFEKRFAGVSPRKSPPHGSELSRAKAVGE